MCYTEYINYTYEVNILKLLEDKILAEGRALNENILKVDSFINHKVDPKLTEKNLQNISKVRELQKSQRLKVPALRRRL